MHDNECASVRLTRSFPAEPPASVQYMYIPFGVADWGIVALEEHQHGNCVEDRSTVAEASSRIVDESRRETTDTKLPKHLSKLHAPSDSLFDSIEQ